MSTEEITPTDGLTDDAFDLAFAAATAEPSEPVEESAPVVEPPAEAAETPPSEVEKETPAPVGPAVEELTAPAAEVTPPEPAKAPELKLVPKVESPQPDPAVEDAAKVAAEEAKAREMPTTEEQELFERVSADFPELVQAQEVRDRILMAKIDNLFASKLGELSAQFSQRLAPAEAVAQSVAHDKHTAAILAEHPDAFTALPQVEEWVKSKPSFLQTTYNAVLDKGSAAEIVEMLSIFKKETGSVHVPPAPVEDAAQKAAKEKKLQSQEGVRSRQAAQKGGIDENDFDSAFKAAAGM